MPRDRTGQKQYPKERPQPVYLGDAELKAQRIANLTAAAKLLDLRGLSTLVGKLGDVEPSVLADTIRHLIKS